MNPIRNRILVHFHEEIETPLGLEIPERYVIHTQESFDDNETRMGVTTDRRLINPQIVDILSGKYAGEQGFVYYGAYESAKWVDGNGIITDDNLLFLINPIRMMPGNYLGQQVWREAEKTASGIYLTPDFGGVDGIRIKVNYSGGDVKEDDVIITTDKSQYELIFGGQRYVLVRDKYIAGVNELPYKDNILIEYLPDIDPEREARNAEKKRQKDLMDTYHMFYEAKDFEPEPLPKYIDAIVIEGKYKGKEVIVERNYGVGVSKGRAIISLDTLIAVKNEGQKE